MGYDATDGDSTKFHDGKTPSNLQTGNVTSDGLLETEYIAVYLRNDDVDLVSFSEIRLAGIIYVYEDFQGVYLPNFGSNLQSSQYTLVIDGDDGNGALTLDLGTPTMQPGQYLTIVLALESDWQIVQDLQFLMTTTKGSVFVETIKMGNQIG